MAWQGRAPLAVPMEALHATPSTKDGSSPEEEKRMRDEAIDLLFRSGYRLKLNIEATSAAIIILHRYIHHTSMAQYSESDVKLVLATCLFLAAKSEENSRGLRDVINVTHRLTWTPSRKRTREEMESSLPSQGMDEDEEWSGSLCLDQEYAPLKEKVVHMEQVILRVIGFDLELNHPFRYLLHYGHALRCSQPVIQQAYAITVDALWSPACMSLPPHHIAGGALYLAKRWKRDASLCPPPNTPGEVAGGSAKQAETRFRRESWWEWLGIPTADCERACQHLMDAIEDSFKHRSAHGDGSGRSLNGTDGLKHGAGSVISAASGVTGIGNGSMQQQQQQQQQKQKQQAMDARAKTAAEYFKTRFVTHGSHAGADEPKPVEIASDPSTLGHATLAQARDPPSQPPGKGSPEALLSRNGTDDTESDTGAPPSAKWVRLAPPASATRTRGNGPRASQSSSGASSTVGSLSSSIDAALSAAKSR